MTKRGILAFLMTLVAVVAAPLGLQASSPSLGGYPRDLPAQPGPSVVPGQVLVGLESGAILSEVALTIGGSVLRNLPHGNAHVLTISSGSVGAAVHALNSVPGVAYAEPNYLRSLHDQPNDPDYALKWDLHNDGTLCHGADCAMPDADLDWEEAYAHLGASLDGTAVVAVVDSGVDVGHPDLRDKLVPGYDFLDDDSQPLDRHGHGTHVAGIALARADNATGALGVGYGANIRLMPLRACDENGCPSSAIVDAIYYAADNGANVINLSLGGRMASTAEALAIQYAWSQGLVVVASSGNDSRGRVAYPAAFAHCLAVGSTNWLDGLAFYSSGGKDLDVVAPGGEMTRYGAPGGIYSTMPAYEVYLTRAYAYQQDYDQLQGTSMAASQVSGLAALLFAMGVEDSDHDGKANDEIRDLIETTTDDLGKAGWDRDFGWGRVNVYQAVLAADARSSERLPQVIITSPQDVAAVWGTINIGVDVGEQDAVRQVEFFVDGFHIGSDDDGSDGWSVDWDSTGVPDGPHSLTASATDGAEQIGAESIQVSVANTQSLDVVVWAIFPNVMQAGSALEVQISGSGFSPAVQATFEGGDGRAPEVTDLVAADGGTLLATVIVQSEGAASEGTWDLRVANPNGATGVLVDGLTVRP